MVVKEVVKKYRKWRIERHTRDLEFKPPQFSHGSRIGGLRYYTEGDDDAPVTIIFVHGYTLAASAWHLQIASLADRARCIAMDLRGHGKSAECGIADCTIDGAADDVMAVLDDAAISGSVIFVGHSLGGMVVLNLLRRYPQFRVNCQGVVLISTSARPFASDGMAQLLKLPVVSAIREAPDTVDEDVALFRDKVLDLVAPAVRASAFSGTADEAMADFHLSLIKETPLNSIIGFLDDLEVHDEIEALPYLKGIPGEVIVGDGDVVTPVEQSELIHQSWPGSRLTVVSDGGHMLPLEKQNAITMKINSLLDSAYAK